MPSYVGDVRLDGKGGAEITNRAVTVWGVRHGKVTYLDAYRTKAEALEAVGLRE